MHGMLQDEPRKIWSSGKSSAILVPLVPLLAPARFAFARSGAAHVRLASGGPCCFFGGFRAVCRLSLFRGCGRQILLGQKHD